jgi:hypothetical protein
MPHSRVLHSLLRVSLIRNQMQGQPNSLETRRIPACRVPHSLLWGSLIQILFQKNKPACQEEIPDSAGHKKKRRHRRLSIFQSILLVVMTTSSAPFS